MTSPEEPARPLRRAPGTAPDHAVRPGQRSYALITLASGQAGKPVSVGLYSYPTAIALAPAGSTAVVVDTYGDHVSLVNTTSRRALKSINVGSYPIAVAVAP